MTLMQEGSEEGGVVMEDELVNVEVNAVLVTRKSACWLRGKCTMVVTVVSVDMVATAELSGWIGKFSG